MKCPRAQQKLMAYHDSELSAGASRRLVKHLESCQECSRLLERLRSADRHTTTTPGGRDILGLPDMPGPDDRYWESFTARVMDRVEEDAATRVPEKIKTQRSWDFFIPRMAPAFSIALVVVVAAGVLMKIGGPTRVIRTPVTAVEPARKEAAPVVEDRVPGSGMDAREGQDGFSLPEEEAPSQREDLARTAAKADRLVPEDRIAPAPSPAAELLKKTVSAPVPEVKEEAPVKQKVPVAPVPSKSTAIAEPGIVREGDRARIATAPVVKDQAPEALPVTRPAEQSSPGVPDAAAPESPANASRTSSSSPVVEVPPDDDQAMASVTDASAQAAAPGPVEGAAQEVEAVLPAGAAETIPEETVQEETVPEYEVAAVEVPSADDARTGETAPPASFVTEADSPPGSPGTGAALFAPGEPSQESRMEVSGMRAMESNLEPESGIQDFAPRKLPYRGPEDQLTHARNLAEVRKFWESEQVLKDLLSQNPSDSIQEEASVLLVKVLSGQNRVVEAQQVLDDAKTRFPASETVQSYELSSNGGEPSQ